MTSWQPNERYPDPAVRVLDSAFNKYRLPLASVERLYTGCRWSEGPVYLGDNRCLLWSDIPNNRILRWDEETGVVSIFRKPSNNANGHTRDRYGRLVGCEHDTRRVVRTEYDGSITVLADSYNGKKLNSPNDVVVKSDHSVWFTDPTFGILGYYEGHKDESENTPAVYRLDATTGKLAMMTDEVAGPNGLAFSPDGSVLYVIESRALPHRLIWGWDVASDGTLSNKRLVVDAQGPGALDGMAVDSDGRLWCGFGDGGMGSQAELLDGVRVYAPDGTAIGHIHLPERCANVCFGGQHRNRLFMASSHSLYALYVNTTGA